MESGGSSMVRATVLESARVPFLMCGTGGAKIETGVPCPVTRRCDVRGAEV